MSFLLCLSRRRLFGEACVQLTASERRRARVRQALLPLRLVWWRELAIRAGVKVVVAAAAAAAVEAVHAGVGFAVFGLTSLYGCWGGGGGGSGGDRGGVRGGRFGRDRF